MCLEVKGEETPGERTCAAGEGCIRILMRQRKMELCRAAEQVVSDAWTRTLPDEGRGDVIR